VAVERAAKAHAKAPQPWYRKKRSWLLGVIALIVIVAVAASVGSKHNNGGSKNRGNGELANSHPNMGCVSPPPAYPDHQSTDCVAPASGSIGIANTTVTATWATATTDSGDNIICATVSITNHNTGIISYTDLYWRLQTPSGKVEETDLETPSGGSDLGGGHIVAGGIAGGTVCFDDASESGTYVGIYKPDPFESNRGIWLFSAS